MKRREFLRKTLTGIAGFTIIPHWDIPPSDRVRIAHIGVGGMGNTHLKWFAELPEVQIAALCDVDKSHLAHAFANLRDLNSSYKVQTFTDFRHVLDQQDIDAITCATPDHWHAQIAQLAFESGKDVYGEKPLSYDVLEGQNMLHSLEKNNRIFQLGTQIHAGENYHRAVEIIQSGILGKVHEVKLWKTGKPTIFEKASYQPVPEHLDWDMWQGPAPARDYHPERCHRSYRYFRDYSGGIFADFWCHIADVAFWALQPIGLREITARGTVSTGIGDTPEQIDIHYQFDDLEINWSSEVPNIPGAADKHIGAYFMGANGTLLCDYDSMEIRIDDEILTDIESVPKSLVRSPGHQQNFVDCIKSRDLPESHLSYARYLTLPMHLGLIAFDLKRTLHWDAAKEKFIKDKEADKYLSRKPRKSWALAR